MSDHLPRVIQTGEITGYRIWYVHNGELKGTYQRTYIWNPGINVTKLPPSTKPDFKKVMWQENEQQNVEQKNDEWWGAGFHAFKKIDKTYDYFTFCCGKHFTWAFGRIYMWGDVIETRHGYRSSHATIQSIDFLHPGAHPNLTALEILHPKYYDKFINQPYPE
ncbi:MAG TPA: hypothetical protein VEP90_11805, partial [Methylomirabilota bacterium]|nr:hypothetical protein [Methylomirabilota bacterium]